MFSLSNWPFYPSSLSEVIEPETLTLIETGSSERLRRPLTILDFEPATGRFTRRIESIEEMRRYEDYCRCLRSSIAGNETCLQWDLEQALVSLRLYQETGELYRSFPCHMQLVDMSYIIELNKRPVALLLTGQYCPPEGAAPIRRVLEQLDQPGVNGVQRAELHRLVEQLTPVPGDARANLEREAEIIRHIAQDSFALRKRNEEEIFLDQLGQSVGGEPIVTRDDLVERMERLLDHLRQYIHCQYMMVFSAVLEDDTVLSPLANSGLTEPDDEGLPHFNWRKANLPLEKFDLASFDVIEWRSEALARGVRGKNTALFQNATLFIPVSLNNRFRAVMAFGPFHCELDLEREVDFLKEATERMGMFCLTNMEVIALEEERSRWKNTARLLTHQFKTALTPITTNIGRARAMLRKPPREIEHARLDALLRQSEDMALSLADSAREILSGSITLLSKDDLNREDCHLAVLVANCAAGFIDDAESKNREIDIDRSIEMLPEAEVDLPRLTIALENLLENAIKYSYGDTVIRLRSHIDYGKDRNNMLAVIEISDLGREVRQNERDLIFQLGVRGSNIFAAGKGKALPGSGLGLWQTRSIIEAHGGSIQVACEPTSIFRRERRAYHVTFTVTIPLNSNRETTRR